MNCTDILSQHQELKSIIFRLDHRGVQVEAVMSCLLPGGLAVSFTAPREMAGLEAHCCHIPYFAYPTLRGYVYRGVLTAKAVECIRRAIVRRIDGHLFLQAHGAEVRELFKHVAADVYRETVEQGLYDYSTFKQLRVPLLQRYKLGDISQKEYQQALKKLKQPYERHDRIYWDVERLFHERLREEFPELKATIRIDEIFSNYACTGS